MSSRQFQTTKSERAGFLSYFFGQNALFFMVTYLAALYYTTVLGIPLAISATIFLFARIWDGVNDPLLSILVEKARLKGGKFLPWLKSVAFILPIATILIFGFTDALINSTLTIRVIYATVTYTLWGMVYTISDVPGFALATVMSSNQNEKTTLLSLSRMIALVGLLTSSFLVQGIIDKTGSWTTSAIILAIGSFVFLFGIFLAKERVQVERKVVSLKQIVKSIVQNKYTMSIFAANAFLGITNFALVIYPFLAIDFFKDPGLQPVILAAFLVPIVISAPLTPMLVRKFGKKNIFLFSLVVSAIFSILIYFIGPDNFGMFITLMFIRSLVGGFSFVIQTLLYADSIEYNYYKNGERYEAATFAAQTFSGKSAGAIASAIAMGLLAFFGYKESIAGEIVIQSQSTLDSMWALFNLAPVVGCVIAFVFFKKVYDLSEEKLNEMKIAYELKNNK